MPRRTLVFLHFESPLWLAITHTVVEAQISRGNGVTVVDVSAFSIPSGATYTTLFPSPAVRRFRLEMAQLGVRVLKLRPKRVKLDSPGFTFTTTLEEVIDSHLATWMRTPNPRDVSGLARFLARRIERKVITLSEVIGEAGLLEDADELIVPSGRSPVTRYLGELAARLEKNLVWTEEDRYWGGLFQEKYRLHDRVATHNHFQRWMESCTHDHKFSSEWLEKRISLESRHSFSKNFQMSTEGSKFENIFFQSSPDEFMHLDEEINQSDWKTQFEAFATILKTIDPTGDASAIRLHPILSQKSFTQVRSTYRSIRNLKKGFPRLTVLHSDSGINSYDLVKNAKRVFVSRSTIMLEATYLRKSVWHTEHYFLDECLDVRKVFRLEHADTKHLEPWDVSSNNTLCALDFIHERQSPILHRDKYSATRQKTFVPSFSSILSLVIVVLWRRQLLTRFLTKP